MSKKKSENRVNEPLKNLVEETSTLTSGFITQDVSNPEVVENSYETTTLNETTTLDGISKEKIKVGDKVKLKPEIGHDILGHRIHNGIKNYSYTVKNIRSDGYLIVECLTYIFTVHPDDLTLIRG